MGSGRSVPRSRAVLTAGVLAAAWVAAVPASAWGMGAMRPYAWGASPVLSDGHRFAAYHPARGVMRVLDGTTGRSFRQRTDCRLVDVSVGLALLDCEARGADVLDLRTRRRHRVRPLADTWYEVGRHWVYGTSYAGIRFDDDIYVNWRTGRTSVCAECYAGEYPGEVNGSPLVLNHRRLRRKRRPDWLPRDRVLHGVAGTWALAAAGTDGRGLALYGRRDRRRLLVRRCRALCGSPLLSSGLVTWWDVAFPRRRNRFRAHAYELATGDRRTWRLPNRRGRDSLEGVTHTRHHVWASVNLSDGPSDAGWRLYRARR